MNRRGLIARLGAAIGAVALPAMAAQRDDTERLQRLIDSGGSIPAGTYRVSRTIRVRSHIVMSGSSIEAAPGFDGTELLSFERGSAGSSMTLCVLDTRHIKAGTVVDSAPIPADAKWTRSQQGWTWAVG